MPVGIHRPGRLHASDVFPSPTDVWAIDLGVIQINGLQKVIYGTGAGAGRRQPGGAIKVSMKVTFGAGVGGRRAAGTPTVIRWKAGARYNRTDVITSTSSSASPAVGTYNGVHFTAATITVLAGSTFNRCSFDGIVINTGTGTVNYRDCFMDYTGGSAGAFQVQDPCSVTAWYCSGIGFNDVGWIHDSTGTLTLNFVKGRPHQVAPPGPPSPVTIMTPTGAHGRRQASAALVVTHGPVRAVFAAGVGGRRHAGSITSVTVTASGSASADLQQIPAYTAADVTALGLVQAQKQAPNWKRLLIDTENNEHGPRDSLFLARNDVGYCDIKWDTAAGTFKAVATPSGHLTTGAGGLQSGRDYGIFPGAVGSNTTTWRHPILSDLLGVDVIYDVSGWAYLRNISFQGRYWPASGQTGSSRPRILVYNVECKNLATSLRSDISTFYLAPDPDSGTWNPKGFQMVEANIRLTWPGNGDSAYHHNDCAGSCTGIISDRYQQDSFKEVSPDFWMACRSGIINPTVRSEIDATPPYGAVWIRGTGVANTDLFFTENTANQENTAISILGQATPSTAQSLTITTRTVTNESWADTGKGNPPAVVTTLHFDVRLACNTAGTILSTCNDLLTALAANSTFTSRCSVIKTGVSDGTGIMPIWEPISGQGDRFQIPSAVNDILAHSDFRQLGTYDQTGFVPPMKPNGSLALSSDGTVGSHASDHFVFDPNYPGVPGTCDFKSLCLQGNHSGIYLQQASKNGGRGGKWPADASKHYVMDRPRIHGFNTMFVDNDTIGCGFVKGHVASAAYPQHPSFSSTADQGNVLSCAPSPGYSATPYATTDPMENCHHINHGNVYATDNSGNWDGSPLVPST